MAVIQYESDVSVRGRVLIDGGLPHQFLKADGSLDSNTYALASSVHNPVTLGTANGLSLSTQKLSLGLASSGVTGALSGTDWNTFNGKQPAITGLTTNYLTKWNGSGFGNSLIFDNGTNIGIGTANPTLSKLHTKGDDGNFIGYFYNNSGTAGQVKGVVIEAGTNTSDFALLVNSSQGSPYFKVNGNGNSLFGTTQDNLVDRLQVNGNGRFSGKLSITGGGISTSISNVATTVTQTIVFANPATKLGIGYVAEDFPMIQTFNNSNNSLPLSINPFGGNVGIGTTNPTANLTVKGAYSVGSSIPTNWALLSAGRTGVANNNKGLYFDIFNDYAEVSTYDWSLGQAYPMVFQGNGGNSMFGTNVDNGVDRVQVAGTISASPATTANQVPTWGQVQAVASSGRYTPTVNVITGATSVSVQSHTYIKIGKIVTVYGESKPTPVVTGVTVIYEISLPIARANTVTKALGFGSINVAGGSTNQFVRLESLSATTVRISFNIDAAGTPSVLYSFQYDITQ